MTSLLDYAVLSLVADRLKPTSALTLMGTCRTARDTIQLDRPTCRHVVRRLATSGKCTALTRMRDCGQFEPLGWSKMLQYSGDVAWDGSLCAELLQLGLTEIVALLHAAGCAFSEHECAKAAECGALDTLRDSVNALRLWDPQWTLVAARHGHWNVLEWVHSEGHAFHPNCCVAASEGGWYRLLRWMRSEARLPWGPSSVEVCRNAARDGDLDTLMWAHLSGCAWDEGVTEAATRAGHLTVLAWLRENGCP